MKKKTMPIQISGIYAILIFINLLIFSKDATSQAFTPTEYKKAMWMTTRMYGGQRSGENNWIVYDHLPIGVDQMLRGKCFIDDKDTDGYDLSGGWHDAGDHVKFGQTQFYSAYMLLKGYVEFPTGYDDYYSYDYAGYKNAGDWTWEGNKHDPNGIPDVLDEVKHATDYFIKCTRNSTTFYYQVGQGNPDHAQWVTAVKMQTLPQSQGGAPRVVYKNPNGASMASFCGASLALMSRVYRRFDPAYADLCLQHAIYAYAYAKIHPGVAGTGDGSFYGPNGNWKDDYATMCAELFWATNDESYKTEALSFSIGSSSANSDIYGTAYGLDYENNGDIAIYNLALLGKTNARTLFSNNITTNYLGNVQADGQFNGGNVSWGPLRYNANTAMMVALWQKMEGTDSNIHTYVYDNIDYILGHNSDNLSFVVGFGSNSVKFPHHRNFYLRDDNPDDATKRTFTIPTKNAQFGLLVGGARTPSAFNDDPTNYQQTEGGIDENAGLVGTLAFIISKVSPIDTSKFGHPLPKLGFPKSLCGVSSILLNSQIPVDGKKTFSWFKNGTEIIAASTSANQYTANEPGTYTCIVDSAGNWSTKASVEITASLPSFDLGGSKILCDPAYITLDIGITGTGITYEWEKNGNYINGANSSTLTVYAPGIYRGNINASGCASKYNEVTITSSLPFSTTHDTICTAGSVNIEISGSGGPYEWYDAETAGSLVNTGEHYSPNITSSTIYYVQDQTSVSAIAGSKSGNNNLQNGENGGLVGMRFNAAKPFTITQMSLAPFVYYCDSYIKLYFTFQLKQGTTVLGTYKTDTLSCIGEQSSDPFDDYYVFNFAIPINIPAAGSYELNVTSGTTQLVWFTSGADFTSMDIARVIDITDDTRADYPNSFPGIFDIKIQAGTGCARAPVLAIIDPLNTKCTTSIIPDYTNDKTIFIFPNPSYDQFYIESEKDLFVKVFDIQGKLLFEFTNEKIKSFGKDLHQGIYHVVFYKERLMYTSINVIKN